MLVVDLRFVIEVEVPLLLFVAPFGRPLGFEVDGVEVVGRGGLKGFGGIVPSSCSPALLTGVLITFL